MKKQRLSVSSNNISPGEVQFFSKVAPPLPDGDYTITSDHVVIWGDKADQKKRFQKTQQFSVQGPRFKIDPSDVHSTFPANGASGRYEHILPQIILNKRSLPWEHMLEPGDTSGAPWLALLLLDEDQVILNADSGVQGNTSTLTGSVVRTLKEVRNLNYNGLLGPVISHLDYGQTDDSPCQTIDILTDTFQQVIPHITELPYLAHCRQVNIESKEVFDMNHPGWFSVIISNRFPVNPDKKAVRQVVHLVSLEGFKPYLVDKPAFPAGINTVRLISLYSWSFSSIPDHGKSFSELMLNLVSPASEEDTDLLMRFPVPSGSIDSSPDGIAVKALSSGYVPMPYHTMWGNKTFAWYRGPLSPVKTERFTRRAGMDHFSSASDAVIYDTKTGMFNMSYSAAWQIGRLMALSSRGFAIALLNWRRQSSRLVDLIATRAKLDDISDFLKNYDEDINIWMNGQIITDAFVKYLVSDFAKQVIPKFSEKNSPDNGTDVDGTGGRKYARLSVKENMPEQLVEELKKLMEQEEVRALLGKLGGEEFTTMTEWLAKSSLLYDLPFDYMVPGAQMLPAESIRFFYLDRAWTDSLIDGAMSIGIQGSRDSHYYRISKDIIRDAVDKLILEIREELLGIPVSDKDPTDGTISGFLLRSEVVSAWPGLEVKGYSTVSQSDDSTPVGDGEIKLLRMDRLSPNVLLCLFPGTPAWIEFNEPKEGICFGTETHENDELIYIRDPKNGELVGETTYRINENNDPGSGDYRDVSGRVLNIANLSQHIATKANIPELNAADFALQMVNVPEKMVFQNKPGKSN